MKLTVISIFKHSFVICLLVFFCANFAQSENYTLKQYMADVLKSNGNIVAGQLSSESAKLRLEEGYAPYTPMFFANINRQDDRSPTNVPSFQGNRTITSRYQLGLSQNFTTGTTAKLYYDVLNSDLRGANSSLVPITDYYQSRPTFEMTQSLWKNFFGNENRAQVASQNHLNEAAYYSETFKAEQKQVEAETSYWRLVLAKESLRIQAESLERAKKLKDWNLRQVKLQLADKSDLLQSEAALRVRELEEMNAQSEIQSAVRSFNTLRGVDSSELDSQLDGFAAINTVKDVNSRKTRSDIKSLTEQIESTFQNAKLSKEKYKPTLDLTGLYALNGRDAIHQTALDHAWNDKNQTWAVGLKFSTSLDVGFISDLQKGYSKDLQAQERLLQQKKFEENRDYLDITKKLEDAKKRFVYAKAIEDVQNERLSHERSRFTRGRTTTYQVLQSEQDYAQSQLSRAKAQFDILELSSKIKLYE